MSHSQKVICAIVTFNGAKTISDTLNALLYQTRKPDAYLIIDNASDDQTLTIIRKMQISNLKIKSKNKNEGVAAAYNLALKEAIKNDYNWLWMFDQDSICQPDCLEKLLSEAKIIKAEGLSPGILFPSHYLKSNPGHLLPPWKWNGRAMVEINTPSPLERNHTSVHTSMISGALYNLAKIEKESGFIEEFFIDFVEHEYHMRLNNKGYQLFWVNNARILHGLGKTQSNSNGQFVVFHDSWRYYFIGRNMFLCYWKWGGFPALFYLWKSVKSQKKYIQSFDEIDHKAIWMYFKRGIRNAVLSRFLSQKPPETIIPSYQ